MSDFESKIDINIDASQALAAIKTLQRQISDFHTSLAKGSATANLKSLQMQQSLIDTINATGQYSAQMKTVASSTQAFTTALEKNKLSMGQYFKYAGGASKSFGRFFKSEMDTIHKVAIERVKDLQTQYIKMGRDANGALRTIAVRPLALDMENLATKTQIAAQKQQLLNQLLKQGSTNLLNFGKNTQWAGRQLMVGFTIPLGILGTTAAKTFMQMEEQAIKFKRVYGDTFTATSETDAMIKQVQQLATEFTKYGVAVEKTMEQAATAAATGKMGADLLAQVSESTRLSVLGNVEQQKALETTISLTNAFGTASDELRGKINFLNAVENQTITSIEDLTTAIPKAAPVIKQLGGNVEDLAFFLTAMREGGINASEGANALKSGLASLINPTNKATKMLEGFGINITGIVEKNKGDVKNLVIDFAKALDTLDPLNRARAIEQLFGKFQFSRLSTLFQNVIKDGSQAARVLELTKQSSAELGILAQRELNRISSSPMYKFQKAIADFKKELAPVGEEFIKAVTPLIQFGTDILKTFNKLDGGVKQFIVNTTGVIAGLGPIFLMTFGLIANGVANIIKGFTFVKTVFNKASSASTILGETTDYMTQQQLEAAAVAASLEQVHNKLTQAFTVETTAVNNLASAYAKAIAAQTAFTGASVGGKGKAKPKKYADGIFSVPGPKGAGDIVPAMLSPGEAVIPAKPAQKYRGFIRGMIAGKIPGFNIGEPDVGGSNPAPKTPRKPKTLADAVSKLSSTQPKYLTDQTAGLMHPDFPNEQQIVREAFAAQGFDIDGIDSSYQTYIQPHAAHMGGEGSSRAVTVDTKNGKFSRWIKNWMAKLITPQLGLMNKYMQDISYPDMEARANDPRQKGKKVDVYRKFMREDNLRRVAKALKIPLAEVKRHAAHLFAGNEALTPQQTAVLGEIAKTHRDTVQITDKMGKKARRQAQAEIARTQAVSRVASRRVSMANDPRGFFLGRGKYKENEAKRKAFEATQEKSLQAAANKANRAEVKARTDETAAAKARSKAAVETSRAAKAKAAAARKEAKETKRTSSKKPAQSTQSKVSATPTVKVTEQLGNGVTRTVDANGKERFKINGRFASPEQAKAAMSGAGAAASPKGRLKGIITGLPGKLGIAGLATMGAGAVTGNEQVSSLADQLFTAAMLSSFIPPGTMKNIGDKFGPIKDKFVSTKFGASVAGKFGVAKTAAAGFKTEALASIASKGLMKSLPFLAKGATMVGLRFFNMIPILGQVALGLEIAFNVLTINARKQEEISKAIVETLSMTKERLDSINEFFGTDAKLSGLRTATLGSGGVVGEKQSLAEQFRQSEQFGALYKDQAQKLKGASDQQFAITMQALGIDLMGQGVGEEQVQIIIDAIKKEAGKQSVVINFKDLRIDTETGRKNLAKSLGEITTAAIKEYKSNRDFLGFNFEATAKLDELGAQVAGFISGLSQEFVNGKISVEEFNSSFEDIANTANKIDEANPGDGIQFLQEAMMAANPELAAGMAVISDYPTYLNAMNAAAKGAALSMELLADLASSVPEIKAKAEKYLQELNDFQDQKNRDIKKQQSLISGLTNQQKNLQKQEQNINDTYDERIKALERINQLQEQISKQKQNELDLADALSRGDVFAAAQAAQKIRADQAALALEQQKNALQDEKDKKTGDIQDKQDAISNSISSANTELQGIMDRQQPTYDPSANGKMFTAALDKMWQTFGWIWNLTHFWLPDAEKKSSFYEQAGSQIKAVYDMFPGLFPQGKATGGHITGPGSGTSDSIPAMLSNGEYVIRANAVKAIGTDTLDKLNYADRAKFADGGLADGLGGLSQLGLGQAAFRRSEQFGLNKFWLEKFKRSKDKISKLKQRHGDLTYKGYENANMFGMPSFGYQTRMHSAATSLQMAKDVMMQKGINYGKWMGLSPADIAKRFGYADGGKVDFGIGNIAAGLSNPLIQGGAYGTDVMGGFGTAQSYQNVFAGKGNFWDWLTAITAPLALAGFGGAGKAGGIGKLFSKFKKPSTLHTPAFEKHMDNAYVNFMRTNPRIAVRMNSDKFIEAINRGDTSYKNRYQLNPDLLGEYNAKEAADRLKIEQNVFGIPTNAPGSVRPIYGAAVDTRLPFGIRGKQSSDSKLAKYFVQGSKSYVDNKDLDRYGDINLLLKKKVNKRSTFTIGDTYSPNNFRGENPSIPAKFGTLSRSKILNAKTNTRLPEFQFVESQIFGGLPFSDIKKILVNNPKMVGILERELSDAGLKIPVGMPKLGLKGKLLQRLLKNKTYIHEGKDTGLPLFYTQDSRRYANGGMVKGYSEGGQPALDSMERAVLERYLTNPLSAYSTYSNKGSIEKLASKFSISGDQMFRSATFNEAKRLSKFAVGQTIPQSLDRHNQIRSFVGPSDLQQIGKLAKGLGGNTGANNDTYPSNTVIQYVALDKNVKGIQSVNKVAPGMLDKLFGWAKATPTPYFNDEGFLAAGQFTKILSKNVHKDGFTTYRIGVSSTPFQKSNIGRMAPTPLLPGGNSSLPSYGWSGTNQKFGVGKANGGLIGIPKFKNGGMFRTGYAGGGLAMLHDKEFVMNAGAVKDYGLNNLKAMNNGTYNSGSVYNSYGVNVNVGGSNANANDIARTVIREIKRLDSQNIRSTKV